MSKSIILDYLKQMETHNASDLYITVGTFPLLRSPSGFLPCDNKIIDEKIISDILQVILTPQQINDFNKTLEYNSSLDAGDLGRFRVNVYRQRQHNALVIRRIVNKIPSFEKLKLPDIYGDLAMEKRGLILVVGMTGSGKSTSLASMIDYRNTKETGHIITIEDPIEYYHEHKSSIITQREIGVDTMSYAAALKNALRQRPDVVLVGEIRDREVMEQALMASETGHLCLATLHASNAYQAIERVVNLFPEDQVPQVRSSLSANLKAILSQRLIKSDKGNAVPVLEIMLNQGLIRELIMKGEIGKIPKIMEENTMLGMRTFDQSLLELFKNREISEDTVISNADKPSEMKVKVERAKMFRTEQDADEPALLGHIDTSFLRLKD